VLEDARQELNTGDQCLEQTLQQENVQKIQLQLHATLFEILHVPIIEHKLGCSKECLTYNKFLLCRKICKLQETTAAECRKSLV